MRALNLCRARSDRTASNTVLGQYREFGRGSLECCYSPEFRWRSTEECSFPMIANRNPCLSGLCVFQNRNIGLQALELTDHISRRGSSALEPPPHSQPYHQRQPEQ